MNKRALAFRIAFSFAAVAANAAEVDSYNAGDFDMKYYSAAGCAGRSASATSVDRDGSISNTSATNRNDITCPVVLDRFRSNGSRQYVIWAFRALDAERMTCYLDRYDGNVHTVTTVGAPDFGENPLVFNATGWSYSAAIGCSVPKKVGTATSKITRYLVQEND